MEKVYVVMSGIWYEGSSVVGAFLTQEDALQSCEYELEQGDMYDYIEIIVWQGSQRVERIPYYERGEDEDEE